MESGANLFLQKHNHQHNPLWGYFIAGPQNEDREQPDKEPAS